MKKISFLLVYLLTSVIVCAQHKKISGTITGTQNETIIGATDFLMLCTYNNAG